MSEKLYLSIADPCHEDWNRMTPVEQGRFCSSCKKNVVDFTVQTDEEIISFFSNYNGTACGRFTDDQLDRPIQQIELKPASSFLKYAAGLLLPASLFATKAKAQFKDLKPAITRELPKADISQMLSGKAGLISTDHKRSSFLIKGTVIDEVTKEALAGVSVMIKGTKQGVVTDSNGVFSIKTVQKQTILQYSFVGYEQNEVVSSQTNTQQIIEMQPVSNTLKEVVVVGYTTSRMISGAMSIIRHERIPVWNKIKDTLLPAKVNVYPNPVAASGTINISFPNVKPGQYQIRMLNAAGQLFYSFQKQITGKGETEQIHLTNTMTPGMYMLQVLDEKKKLMQSTKLSVQ